MNSPERTECDSDQVSARSRIGFAAHAKELVIKKRANLLNKPRWLLARYEIKPEKESLDREVRLPADTTGTCVLS